MTVTSTSSAGRPRVTFAAVPGWRTVEIDSGRCTVRVPRGVALDLGATAKALAADRAAAAAHRAADCGVLVGFGGDFAIAGPAPARGWRVRVTDDHRAGVDAPGQWITLRSGGLATSSTTARRWQTAAGVAHHLVDPRTGAPAAVQWRTASASAAGSCLDANIASTAAIVRGEEAVDVARVAGAPEPARPSATAPSVHLAGWPADGR